METQALIQQTATILELKQAQVQAVLGLTEEGCTIPFIARYRKERTGNLDEIQINAIIETYAKIDAREKRREYILNFLQENNKLTPELQAKIEHAETINELEDIYLPFKPRKKTKADKARELGLEPLSILIKEKNLSRDEALQAAREYITENVPDIETALSGALDILVQEFSDSPEVRKEVRQDLQRGTVICSVKRGKKEEGLKYKDYYDYNEPVQKMPAHRIMAILRGEKESLLSITVESNRGMELLEHDITRIVHNKKSTLLMEAAHESLERHLLGSIGNEILKELKEKAETESVSIFSRNLEKILLSSPFGERSVIGIDPGIRTGCKAAVIDKNGDFKDFVTMYLHDKPEDAKKLLPWIETHSIEGISIGDGTFGRETFAIIKELVKDTSIMVALVDEDGASVYSASETAREEFPNLDVTVKGAISIGRRFQDPLAELVKIDPKSLGVGQYQHDITPSLLQENLSKTVEWAVNKVGVNINTAGYHLLGYISGLDKKKAKEIAAYRSKQGKISSREELLKIKGIGEKAFEQAAGFLRIQHGDNVLDSTGVHPESYADVYKIAEFYKMPVAKLVESPEIIKKSEIKKSLEIPELDSIIAELKSKGLDPRKEFTVTHFSDDIKSIDDLTEGMILPGQVDNVAAFGAFVDLGIKDKGLVHISEVSNTYVQDINSVLAVGDTVRVKVISIDKERKRIGLSIKQAI